MPSKIDKNPNFFQRANQRIKDFRKNHPYWFAFMLGAGVALSAATALTLMVFVAPLTPAFLTPVVFLAAKLGVWTIPATIGTFIAPALTLGGFFSAAKGIFNRVFHRSLLVKSKAFLQDSRPDSRSGTTKAIVAAVQQPAPTPPHTPVASRRSSVRESFESPELDDASPPIPGTIKDDFSHQSSDDLTESPLSSTSTLFVPSPEKTAKQYYKEAGLAYDAAKKEVHSLFNALIDDVCSYKVAQAFDVSTAKFRLWENLKKARKAFLEDSSFNVDTPTLLPEKEPALVAFVSKQLNEIRQKTQAPDFVKYAESLKLLDSIGSKELAEIAAIQKMRTCSQPGVYEETVAGIRAARREKTQKVYEQFIPRSLPTARRLSFS